MTADNRKVFVIDDDADIRASIEGLLKSERLPCESFATAREFLRQMRAIDGRPVV